MIDSWAWTTEIPEDELLAAVPQPIAELIELIGIEATLRLIERYEGQALYVPKADGAFRQLKHRRIRKEFTGHNHAQLAKRYGLTTSHLYTILADRDEDRQQNMFDE